MVPFPGFVTTTVYHSSSTSEGWRGALLLGQELLAQGSLPTALWISNLETKPRTTASNSKGFQFNSTNRLDILKKELDELKQNIEKFDGARCLSKREKRG